MVLLLFVINFLFSLLLGFPMYQSLKKSFGSTMVGERMAKGFDYLWWEEFRDESRGLDRTFSPSIINKGALLDNLDGFVQMRFFALPSSILILGFLYIIVHTFLAGGILSVFNQDSPKFTKKRFFEGAGTFFPRFLLLMLISWVFFLAIGFFLNKGLNSILDDISKSALTEVTPFSFGLLFSAAVLFLLLFTQMVFDYARIKVLLEERRDVFKSALEAFGFVFKHPGSTLGLYYLIFFSSIGVSVLYIIFKGFIPQSNFFTVLIAFIFQQLFMFAFIWLRCWLYKSQMELYRYLT